MAYNKQIEPILSLSGFLGNGTEVIKIFFLSMEICSLDRYGRPHFRNLLFHRGNRATGRGLLPGAHFNFRR
jgi:hypothetical protein